MFPLSSVLFPEAGLPLHVFEERYRALMARCLEADGEFGVVLIARGSEVGGGDERVDVGTVARIANAAELEDGRMLVVATGVQRIRVTEWLPDDPYPLALVEDLPDRPGLCPAEVLARTEASLRRLRSLLSELGDVPALPHSLRISGNQEEVGWQLCDMAPARLPRPAAPAGGGRPRVQDGAAGRAVRRHVGRRPRTPVRCGNGRPRRVTGRVRAPRAGPGRR